LPPARGRAEIHPVLAGGGPVAGRGRARRAPVVQQFRWHDTYWMITDVWDGLAVYHSPDALGWTRQPDDNLLKSPGRGAEDQVKGGHADVLINRDRAFLFYFTHPGRTGPRAADDGYEQRRSSIQVVELFLQDGRLNCDRDAPTRLCLVAPR